MKSRKAIYLRADTYYYWLALAESIIAATYFYLWRHNPTVVLDLFVCGLGTAFAISQLGNAWLFRGMELTPRTERPSRKEALLILESAVEKLKTKIGEEE